MNNKTHPTDDISPNQKEEEKDEFVGFFDFSFLAKVRAIFDAKYYEYLY